MLISLLDWDEDTGELDKSTLVPLIDGGTEGFKGNARVIYPGVTACIDCTLDLFPPQVSCSFSNYPLSVITIKTSGEFPLVHNSTHTSPTRALC